MATSGQPHRVDVVVVGAGNAGLIAAIEARERSNEVLLLEASPREERGGNSRFASGVFRIVHNGAGDIRALVGDESLPWQRIEIQDYPAERYIADLERTTQGQAEPALLQDVVELSSELAHWLKEHGVRWSLSSSKFMNLDAIDEHERIRLPLGGELMVDGNGVALIEALYERAEQLGVQLWYDAPALDLLRRGSAIVGVEVAHAEETRQVEARSTILACGSFEASAEARLRYLGPGWDLAKVRGTRFNTGAMLDAAIRAGAASGGHWGGVHAVAVDAGAPAFGDLRVGDTSSRYSFPYGITVNREGRRFFDEGSDEMNFAYATVGSKLVRQPGGVAYQLFDQRTIGLLEPRYATTEPAVADTIEQLASILGIPPDALAATVTEYNAACTAGDFDPYAMDGVHAHPAGQPAKSNWATPLTEAPFAAYPVSCGVTFAFAGLMIDRQARVLGISHRPMPGLYACGEIAGGIIAHNLPGGSGLSKGGTLALIAARSLPEGGRR